MSAHVQSALRYRLTLPAWLLAVAIAAVLAIGFVAVLDASNEPVTRSATAAQAADTTLPAQDTVCVDSRVVGHC